MMNRTGSNGSKVLLSGEHNTYGRNKLKVESQKFARCCGITGHEGAYALALSGSDNISF
jgi:hypothetical protein